MNQSQSKSKQPIYDESPTTDLLAMGSETLEIGVNALNDLERQNEKLVRATDQLDEINHDLKIADKKLDSIESFWVWLGNCLVPTPTPQFKKRSDPQTFNQILLPPSKPQILKSNVPQNSDTYLAAQDADLDVLLEQTKQMKTIATNIGESLETSSGLIDKAMKSSGKAVVKERQMIEKEKKIMS